MPDLAGRSILIVEDDEQTREYLAGALTAREHPPRVVTAHSLDAGRAQLDLDPPDVLLVDLGLPDGRGIELIRHARRSAPGTLSMVITVFGDESSLIGALEAGARGYLLKSEAPADLHAAVVHLLGGGSPISPAIASHLLRRFAVPPVTAEAGGEGASLTHREREVLELMVRGLSYQEMANALDITRNTATSHIRSIYRKLEVRSKTEAVYEAISRGIVTVDAAD